MRVIALVASPHGAKGNTAALTELVLDGARNEGADTETVFLPGGTIVPCKACDVCHKKGICSQKDDFEAIKQKIYESDAIILGSPNYIWSVSAQMKAFMDRCCGVIHCMSFQGKYGASVVTSGGGDEKPICDYMNHFLVMTGITPVGSVWATMGATFGEGFLEETRHEAKQLGSQLVQACEGGLSFPDVEQAKDEFKQRMQLLMQYRREDWPYEWEYWQKHHGLT